MQSGLGSGETVFVTCQAVPTELGQHMALGGQKLGQASLVGCQCGRPLLSSVLYLREWAAASRVGLTLFCCLGVGFLILTKLNPQFRVVKVAIFNSFSYV